MGERGGKGKAETLPALRATSPVRGGKRASLRLPGTVRGASGTPPPTWQGGMPPLSKGGGRRRRPEGFRRALPYTPSPPQPGRNPSAFTPLARHSPRGVGDAAPYMAEREASLVKGRWTPKAAGGILAAWPLMPLSRQPGRNPSASQSSAPPFDKGGFTKFKLFYNNVTIFERIWPCFCGKIFV